MIVLKAIFAVIAAAFLIFAAIGLYVLVALALGVKDDIKDTIKNNQ